MSMTFTKHLYDSIPGEDLQRFKSEAISKFGRFTVQRAEGFINKLTKSFIDKLRHEHDSVLKALHQQRQAPFYSTQVQELIAKHFESVRQFWGTAGTPRQHIEAYQDLAHKYATDARFTVINGNTDVEFGRFMSTAMLHFCVSKLSSK
jgi:membrane-bound lytic murein transglycosylase B